MFTNTERVWILLGKKKSGEASPAELDELSDLLRSYTIHQSVIDELWQTPFLQHTQNNASVTLWNRIENKINETSTARIYRLPSLYKWAAAAAILIIAGLI